MREYLLCLFVAAAATYLLTPAARSLAERFGAIAEVRARDVHTVVTARWGGLAMYGGLVAAYLFASHLPRMSPVFEDTETFRAVLISATILVILGLLDDKFDIDASTKLAGQALAAGLLAYQGVGFIWLPLGNATILDPITSVGLTVMVVLVTINAVNFIDGLDGLAAGVIGISALASFVYSYWLSGHFGLERATLSTLISATIAGMAIGFLPHNFNPARIFMGDTGSMLLGLLLSTSMISLTGQVDPNALEGTSLAPTLLPLLLPVAVLGLPMLDLMLAIIRRTSRGQNPFAPDKEHLHHRLLQRGHSARRAAYLMYAWAALVSFFAVSLAFISWTIAVPVFLVASLILVQRIRIPKSKWESRVAK
jgi:UDP-GlcNAc:undecaprenyl-phosphate GlcNAc-1-phosphate transferase